MIHPITAKTCTEAWLGAANLLAGTADRIAYNVILDIEQPITVTEVDQRIVEAVDRFLKKNEADPVATVAATIFPASRLPAEWRQRRLPKTFPKRRIQS